MQENQNKVKVAQDKAAAAWTKWAAANDACRESYRTADGFVGGGYEAAQAYKRYNEACKKRDACYAEAVEDAEEFWRQECWAKQAF